MSGVPGVGVTPLSGGAPVDTTNPLAVAIVAGGTGLVKFATIGPSTGLANGDNQVVAAVAAKKIRVLSFSADFGGVTLTASWFSAAAGTEIYAGGTGILGWDEAAPNGLMETVAGEALVLNVSAAAAAGSVSVSYVEL